MNDADGIRVHEEQADLYDRQVREYESWGHDVLFGMSYEYVGPGERLLDLGIGTGLSSAQFARAGLEVYGLDGSSEMLKVCRSKGFTRELRVFDLNDTPLPYPDSFFSHAISCGVFHFLQDLEPLTAEVSRIIGSSGLFAFTVAVPPGSSAPKKSGATRGRTRIDTPWGVAIWAHHEAYIRDLLGRHGFDRLKRQRLLVRGGPEGAGDLVFAAHVARRRRT